MVALVIDSLPAEGESGFNHVLNLASFSLWKTEFRQSIFACHGEVMASGSWKELFL